jgi:hypothetical protein
MDDLGLTEQEVAARFEAEEAGAGDAFCSGLGCVVGGEDVSRAASAST